MNTGSLINRALSSFALLTVLALVSCATPPETEQVAESPPESVERTIEPVEEALAIYEIEATRAIYAIEAAQALYTIAEAAKIYASPEEEIVIPVVEPKKIEPRKAYIEPVVKVQVMGEASSITIEGEAELSLSFGANFMKIEPGSRLTFKPRSARVSVRAYTVGIATFEGAEYESAVELAAEWKRKGYTVRLIKAGGPLVQADGSISDTTVYWVALGMFRTEKTAEKFKDKMFSWGVSAWVIDESLLGPRGAIEILGPEGHPKAYADSRVYISSPAPIHIFNVPFGQGFWSSSHKERRRYESPLEIVVGKRGKLSAINETRMEQYVGGIVPVEIRLTAHEEALKTQAVAARTEATAKIGIQHLYDPFDFCASQHCQEFGGLTRRTPRTDAAVDETRGQVLMYNGSLIDAVYSANCGGHTEHNDYVWTSRPAPALRGVSDLYSNPESFDSPIPSSQVRDWVTKTPRAYCGDPRVGDGRKFRWSVTYSASKIKRLVNRHRRVGDVTGIKLLKRGVSGRAIKMKITGSRDTTIINKELQIRRILGGLRSSMFVVDVARDSSGAPTSFTFRGGGWGHGVGMCQAGAEGMALRGFDYTQILRHYFSGVVIKGLYD